MIVVGAPLDAERGLFNTAVVIHRGRVLGAVPRATCPSTASTTRSASSAPRATRSAASCACWATTFRSAPTWCSRAATCRSFALHVEICEDLWTPIPPSTYGALAGATVLANLSASNITIGKADYRRALCEAQSARTISGYVYTAAGLGESTTDLAWDGQALIYENGDLLAESRALLRRRAADPRRPRSRPASPSDRAGTSSYGDSIRDHRRRLRAHAADRVRARRRRAGWRPRAARWSASRTCRRTRRAATSAARRSTTSRSAAWRRGCVATGIEKIVIGVSGGLDSHPRADRRRRGPWTGSGLPRDRTCSRTRCPALPRAR